MADEPKYVRIFLSSPGDVPVERGLATRIIERLNREPLLRHVHLDMVAWDDPTKRTPMLATKSPQQAIDEGLPRPSACHIVVVIFWSRMGSPLDVDEHGTKPNGDPYWSGTEWEYLDAMQGVADNGTGMPYVVVYRRMDKPPVPDADDLDALQDFVTQRQRVQRFFEDFRSEGVFKRGVNEYETPEAFEAMFENDIKVLIDRVLAKITPTAATPIMLPETTTRITWDGSPFPGLKAFTPADEPIFFGRGREVEALLKVMADNLLVAVVGASGSGKSSLVGAGILPRLRDNAIAGSKDWYRPNWSAETQKWTGLYLTPGSAGGDPLAALYEALLVALPALRPHPLEATERKAEFIDGLKANPQKLNDTLAAVLMDAPDWVQVLFFIDQFEELFTLVPPELQAPFAAVLRQIGGRARFILTVRADFYHRALPLLTEALRTGTFPLDKPSLVALLRMIEQPANVAGLNLEPGLSDRIIADTGDEPGALALMAYLLDELYHARADDGDLTIAAYDDLGGVQGAIGTRAEKVYAEDVDDEARAALLPVFRELVEVDAHGTATRRRTPRAQVVQTAAAARLVSALTSARLLVQSEQDHRPIIEVAHEALFRSWERLVQWIKDEQSDLILRRQMVQAAAIWEQQDRDEEFLWTGQRLKEAQAMAERQGLILNDDEAEFLRSEVERLEEKLHNDALDHTARDMIGAQLRLIGDTRQGVGLRQADNLPDIAWCLVPEGKIMLEDNEGIFDVVPFYIAKYPVTYVQFQAFLDDPDGFVNPGWWQDMGQVIHFRLAEQRYKFDNHPRETVSWYQAVAFCRWLNAKLPRSAWPEGTEPDWTIRLPTEWEWQQAATGGMEDRKYPWAGRWDSNRCNTSEGGLRRTTVVGMYPQGASPVDALDMTGNVWEWCLNEYENARNIELSGTSFRVLRGGSWYDASLISHCSDRRYDRPDFRNNNVGFRVCLGSAP